MRRLLRKLDLYYCICRMLVDLKVVQDILIALKTRIASVVSRDNLRVILDGNRTIANIDRQLITENLNHFR